METDDAGAVTGKPRKQPGRVANPSLVRGNVMLDADLLEWGKQQPEGLSGLVRDLLRKEKARRDREEGKSK